MSKSITSSKSLGFTVVEGLLIVLVLALIGGAGWYVYSKHHAKTVVVQSASIKSDPYSGWKAFTDNATSNASGISIKYPSDWQVNPTASNSYAWSIVQAANTKNTITVNYVFQNGTQTAQQGWKACDGTDACGGSPNDKILSSSDSTINGLNAYSASVKNSNGTYHVTVIRGSKPSSQGTPFVMFTTYATDQATLNTFNKVVDSATFTSSLNQTPDMSIHKLAWSDVPKDLQQGLTSIWDSKVPGWRTAPVSAGCRGPGNANYTVYEVNDTYAEAGLYCDSGSANLFVKVDGVWQDVESTQSEFSCDVIAKYTIPKSLIEASNPDGAVCISSAGKIQAIQ